VKDIESALEKVQRKAYTDPWGQIQDLVGYRIVCLFASDLDKLTDIIKADFKLLSSENKVEGGADPATFGYMSNHYICQLKTSYRGPRYDSLQGIIFEVQCRTLLMDAWANVSHYLAYKGDASIPEHLRRDFYALSGLFYVADKHFELFYGDAAASAQGVLTKASVGRLDDDSVNLETMRALLRQLYPDREEADSPSISEFVEELVSLDHTSLSQIRSFLEGAEEAIRHEEEVNPPGQDKKPGTRYWDLAAARIAFRLKDAGYKKLYETKYPPKPTGAKRSTGPSNQA
jgi:ppGpp synthetase/RelA/SpoT-type nucleotidyltranferase